MFKLTYYNTPPPQKKKKKKKKKKMQAQTCYQAWISQTIIRPINVEWTHMCF